MPCKTPTKVPKTNVNPCCPLFLLAVTATCHLLHRCLAQHSSSCCHHDKAQFFFHDWNPSKLHPGMLELLSVFFTEKDVRSASLQQSLFRVFSNRTVSLKQQSLQKQLHSRDEPLSPVTLYAPSTAPTNFFFFFFWTWIYQETFSIFAKAYNVFWVKPKIKIHCSNAFKQPLKNATF